MSIEVLIHSLKYTRLAPTPEEDEVILSKADAEAIIAALKTGQAMRDKAKEFIHLAECDGDEDLIEAVEAWDAAVKGEVK